MCGNLFGGGQSSVPIPAPVAPSPAPLREAEQSAQKTQDATRRRAAALASLSNTNLTSPLGLSSQAVTTSASLLGQ